MSGAIAFFADSKAVESPLLMGSTGAAISGIGRK